MNFTEHQENKLLNKADAGEATTAAVAEPTELSSVAEEKTVFSAPTDLAASEERRSHRQLWVLGVVIIVVLAACFVPLPFVIEAPGPSFNVLGAAGNQLVLPTNGKASTRGETQTGKTDLSATDKLSAPSAGIVETKPVKVISFPKNIKTYPTTGQLRMLTVSLRGTPAHGVTLPEIIYAALSHEQRVLKMSKVFPPNVTDKKVQLISQWQMKSSQQSAQIVAFHQLGYRLPTKNIVVQGSKGTPFQPQDQLLTLLVGQKKIVLDQATTLFEEMEHIPPKTKVEVLIKRKGQELTVPVTTRPTGDPERPGSLLGVILNQDITFPAQAEIKLQDVGGPSAGLIFTLGMIDQLSPQDLLAGKKVAGTGTISPTGRVGAISGLAQKLYAAHQAGMEYFIFPRGNCSTYQTIKGEVTRLNMKAYPVGTLSEALQLLADLRAGKTPALHCTAADNKLTPAE